MRTSGGHTAVATPQPDSTEQGGEDKMESNMHKAYDTAAEPLLGPETHDSKGMQPMAASESSLQVQAAIQRSLPDTILSAVPVSADHSSAPRPAHMSIEPTDAHQSVPSQALPSPGNVDTAAGGLISDSESGSQTASPHAKQDHSQPADSRLGATLLHAAPGITAVSQSNPQVSPSSEPPTTKCDLSSDQALPQPMAGTALMTSPGHAAAHASELPTAEASAPPASSLALSNAAQHEPAVLAQPPTVPAAAPVDAAAAHHSKQRQTASPAHLPTAAAAPPSAAKRPLSPNTGQAGTTDINPTPALSAQLASSLQEHHTDTNKQLDSTASLVQAEAQAACYHASMERYRRSVSPMLPNAGSNTAAPLRVQETAAKLVQKNPEGPSGQTPLQSRLQLVRQEQPIAVVLSEGEEQADVGKGGSQLQHGAEIHQQNAHENEIVIPDR